MLDVCLCLNSEIGSLKCNLPSCLAFVFPLRILEALKISLFQLSRKSPACLGLDLDTLAVASFIIVTRPFKGPSFALAVTASTTPSSITGPPFPRQRLSSLIPAFAVDPFLPLHRLAAYQPQAVVLAIGRHRQHRQLDSDCHLD